MGYTLREFKSVLADVINAHKEEYPDVRKFARSAKLSHTTIYSILNEEQDPTKTTLEKLEAVVTRDEAYRLWHASPFKIPDHFREENVNALAQGLAERLHLPHGAIRRAIDELESSSV